MKAKYLALPLMAMVLMNSCNDDDWGPGHPVIDVHTHVEGVHMGDSLPFVIHASDAEVPLSTLKAQLYFGDEMVSETTIRTKVSEQDYAGKIYIPYMKDIPDGKATLKYVLQNINFTKTESEKEIDCTRPDYEYITLVDAEGKEYRMGKTGLYQYEVKGRFPSSIEAYIKAPKYGENGNEITFGRGSNGVVENSTSLLKYSYIGSGKYTITFNTKTYETGPFTKILVDGNEMTEGNPGVYQSDLTLKKGQLLKFEGVPHFEKWWIDPDFFTKSEDGSLEFTALDGNYRIMANCNKQYFAVEALTDGKPATLQKDGSGAIWIIGEKVGKPSVGNNEVGWNPDNAICLAQHEPGKYQVTLVAGQQIVANEINFKFFHQKGWGGEYTAEKITSTSDIVVIPNADGNLHIAEGKSLDVNGIYKFTVDVTSGINSAVLSVEKIGEQQAEVKHVTLNGQEMTQSNGQSYILTQDFDEKAGIKIEGVDSWNEMFVDPDFFKDNGNGALTLNAVPGSYQVTVSFDKNMVTAVRMVDGKPGTLDAEGNGGLWLLGWGLGSPSMSNQFAWDWGTAYQMAEVAPRIYQFTGTAGPEKNSFLGERIRFDYLSFKIYRQNAWDTEFMPDVLQIEGDQLKQNQDGNIELNNPLEEGADYVITVDLSNGNEKPILKINKK